MKTYCLTRKQLYEGLTNCNSEYIAVRHHRGMVVGINVKIALLGLRIKGHQLDDRETNFVGFFPITFSEYIRIKINFA